MFSFIEKIYILKKIQFDRDEKEKKKQFIKAYIFWKKNIKRDKFKYFSLILKESLYYSKSNSSDAFAGMIYPLQNNDIILLPLRMHKRVESSVKLFIDTVNILGIPKVMTQDESDIEQWLSNLLSDNKQIDKINSDIDRLERQLIKLNNEMTECEDNIQSAKENEEFYNIKHISNKKKILKDKSKKLKKDINSKRTVIDKHKKNTRIKNYIFIDDFLCSGNSVSTFIDKNKDVFLNLGYRGYKFKLLCLAVTEEGLEKVNEIILSYRLREVISIEFDKICSNMEYKINEKYGNNNFFIEEKTRVNEIFNLRESEYCMDTAIASYINSPNSNYAFYTQVGEQKKWIPAFPRENISLDKDAHNRLNENIKRRIYSEYK